MCSDGNWLNGLSIARNQSNTTPSHPGAGGRSKENRSGNSRKQAAAMAIARRMRRERMDSSPRVVQRKGAATKNRSIDRYGMMKIGTNGICLSHSKTNTPTSERREVKWLVEP